MIEVRAFVNYGLIKAGDTGYMTDLERAKKAEKEGKIEILNPKTEMKSLTKAIQADKEAEDETAKNDTPEESDSIFKKILK